MKLFNCILDSPPTPSPNTTGLHYTITPACIPPCISPPNIRSRLLFAPQMVRKGMTPPSNEGSLTAKNMDTPMGCDPLTDHRRHQASLTMAHGYTGPLLIIRLYPFESVFIRPELDAEATRNYEKALLCQFFLIHTSTQHCSVCILA